MDARLKAQVRRRARFRCEYCQFPERVAEVHFQLDHIVSGTDPNHGKTSGLWRAEMHSDRADTLDCLASVIARCK